MASLASFPSLPLKWGERRREWEKEGREEKKKGGRGEGGEKGGEKRGRERKDEEYRMKNKYNSCGFVGVGFIEDFVLCKFMQV